MSTDEQGLGLAELAHAIESLRIQKMLDGLLKVSCFLGVVMWRPHWEVGQNVTVVVPG